MIQASVLRKLLVLTVMAFLPCIRASAQEPEHFVEVCFGNGDISIEGFVLLRYPDAEVIRRSYIESTGYLTISVFSSQENVVEISAVRSSYVGSVMGYSCERLNADDDLEEI